MQLGKLVIKNWYFDVEWKKISGIHIDFSLNLKIILFHPLLDPQKSIYTKKRRTWKF